MGWLVQALMLAVGLQVLEHDSDPEAMLAPMLVWDVLALLLLVGSGVVGWIRSRLPEEHQMPGPPASHWYDPVVGIALLIVPVMVSLIGLDAALTVLGGGPKNAGVMTSLHLLGGLTMLLAWLTLHTSMAARYAWLYRRAGGLDFPRTEAPNPVDFAYFSLTLGSSFATSDVEVTTSRMRWQVLMHSVCSFFYNAIVLATAFRLITG